MSFFTFLMGSFAFRPGVIVLRLWPLAKHGSSTCGCICTLIVLRYKATWLGTNGEISCLNKTNFGEKCLHADITMEVCKLTTVYEVRKLSWSTLLENISHHFNFGVDELHGSCTYRSSESSSSFSMGMGSKVLVGFVVLIEKGLTDCCNDNFCFFKWKEILNIHWNRT